MVEYKACQCKNCKRHYMSTAKTPKCTYCNSVSSELKVRNKNPRIVSEYIRRMNAKFLYE